MFLLVYYQDPVNKKFSTMKNLFTKSTLFLTAGIVFAVLTPFLGMSQIVSAPGGGLWSNGTTWVGGIVPGASDNVVISSTVNVNGNSCNNITISNGGVLQNNSNNSYTLNVNGNLTNNGTIVNNVYNLSVNVSGNVSNNGVMSNYALVLAGNGNQQVSSTQLISLANFSKNLSSGRAIATTALNFSGTSINLGNDTLQFTTGSSLAINGGYLGYGVIYKSSLPALQITSGGGAYFYSITLDATQSELNGTSVIYGYNNFKNNVINNGTLQNFSNNSYTLNVTGNFTNNGTIQNSVYYLYMTISGNMLNNGTWENYSTSMNGSTNQNLSMTQPFAGANFSKTASAGRINATSGLSFTGTIIDLGYDTLAFTTGSSIALNGGALNYGVIYKAALPALQITSGNGAYVYSFTIDAFQSEFYGDLRIYGNNNVFRRNVINLGTLQNYQNNSYTLNVAGNITNNGFVQNNVYSLYVNISGNMVNNGTWTNYATTLNGTVNQTLAMTQPFGGSFFYKTVSPGRAIATSGLDFVGTNVDFNADTLEFTTGNAISLTGGYLSTCVLYKSSLPAIQITGGNLAYLYVVTIDAPQTELAGDVRIYGNSNVLKTNVTNSGIIQNYQNNSYTLNVAGDFTNNGTVQNNVYSFYLNVTGNLANNGVWANYSTTLNGNGNQALSMTQPLTGNFFNKNVSPGRAIATTGLSFNGTAIDFNGDTLQFSSGNSLTMNGGYLYRAVLYKTSAPAILITSGGGNYLAQVTIDSPQTGLYGVVLISGNINSFKTNVTNYGTLQNRPNSSYTLPVTGNFSNNGIVQNNVYSFYLQVSGNISNDGTWRNYHTSLTGTNTHSLAFTNRFEGDIFINSNAAAGMTSTTDLIFDGTAIDLNDCSFSLLNGSRLSVLNGSLTDVVISGSNIRFNSLGAYCVGVVFNADVTLQGVFQAGTGVSFNGSIVNDGIMRNRSNSTYSVLVQGGLENNGSITNNVYNFSITILGDIHNNGVWANYLTLLDGTTDQNIFLVNGNAIQGQIRLDANFSGSGLSWWGPQGNLVGNPAFSGANSQNLNFLNPVTDAYAGQYYCVNNQGVHSRNIFIQSQLNPVRTLTLNLLLEGLYNANGTMNPSLDASGSPVWSSGIADQITVELRDNGNFSNIVFAKEEVLLSTSGLVSFAVPAAYSSSYYLAIRHRSGIITVSAAPVSFTTPQVNYNFDVASKAYGSNLALMPDGWYALFGGDVNQDGIVDTADMTPVDNGSAAYLSGYRNPDANGDGVIDTADMTLVDNNSANYISAATP